MFVCVFVKGPNATDHCGPKVSRRAVSNTNAELGREPKWTFSPENVQWIRSLETYYTLQ